MSHLFNHAANDLFSLVMEALLGLAMTSVDIES